MGQSIIDTRKKRGRGRPPVNATQIGLRLPPEDLEALDLWIAEQPDAPSRPEAIRRLIKRGLTY